MSCQMRLCGGSKVALITFEWFLSCVLPPMLGEGMTCPTGKATKVTEERLLACVSPEVVLHGRGGEERIMAGGPGALERLLSRVQLHVVLQRPFLCEAPVTQVTCKFPFFGCADSMFAQ